MTDQFRLMLMLAMAQMTPPKISEVLRPKAVFVLGHLLLLGRLSGKMLKGMSWSPLAQSTHE